MSQLSQPVPMDLAEPKEVCPETAKKQACKEGSNEMVCSAFISGLFKQISSFPLKPAVCVEGSELISSLQDLLIQNNFLGAPVTRNGKFAGFVDMLDLCNFVSQHFINFKFEGASLNDFENVYSELKHYHQTTVKDLLIAQYHRTSASFVCSNYSLIHVFEMLARGHPRVAICDEQRKVVSLVTQSMMMNYVHQRINELPVDIRNCKVKNMRLFEKLLCVHSDDRPLKAFNMMVANEVSGLAVVDNSERLVDVISVRDLRGLKMDTAAIWALYCDSITAFKNHVYVKYPMTTPATTIRATLEDSFEFCLLQMCKYKVHRIFVVNEEEKPIRVISMQDMLANALFQATPAATEA